MTPTVYGPTLRKEHRRIITGPVSVRDWQVICLCGERVIGTSAKDARDRWEKHAGRTA